MGLKYQSTITIRLAAPLQLKASRFLTPPDPLQSTKLLEKEWVLK